MTDPVLRRKRARAFCCAASAPTAISRDRASDLPLRQIFSTATARSWILAPPISAARGSPFAGPPDVKGRRRQSFLRLQAQNAIFGEVRGFVHGPFAARLVLQLFAPGVTADLWRTTGKQRNNHQHPINSFHSVSPQAANTTNRIRQINVTKKLSERSIARSAR